MLLDFAKNKQNKRLLIVLENMINRGVATKSSAITIAKDCWDGHPPEGLIIKFFNQRHLKNEPVEG